MTELEALERDGFFDVHLIFERLGIPLDTPEGEVAKKLRAFNILLPAATSLAKGSEDGMGSYSNIPKFQVLHVVDQFNPGALTTTEKRVADMLYQPKE